MATTDEDLGSRSGRLVESHQSSQPRVAAFYFIISALLFVLAGGLAYQQLIKSNSFRQTERLQTQRRIVIPGPRGNIYDRFGRLLVGNRSRLSVVLYLDELQEDFRREAIRIRINYRATGDKDLPNSAEIDRIAKASVAQGYLDQVNAITGRHERINLDRLKAQFDRRLYSPFTLIDGLSAEEFARLIEHLPANSPLRLYTTNERSYPYGAAAAHTLGFLRTDDSTEIADFPGEDLKTFPMPDNSGQDGLERSFEFQLRGRPGGSIFRVDKDGYTVNPPVAPPRLPVQGKSLTTSLDIDLQLAAEEAIGDQTGAAVALDTRTGEVLVLASEPGYNLQDFSPSASAATIKDIETRGAWYNLAIDGLYPPGSTFKTLVTIAGLRRGTLAPDDTHVDCDGYDRIGNHVFKCDNGNGHHGNLNLRDAIAVSCDIYFYEHGIMIGPDAIAEEARRFHLDRPTGIELPNETRKMIIPDPAWLKARRGEAWTKGNTAITSIGQGDVQVTPLQMACYAASLARNEVYTKPTLLHDPNRPVQHSEPIGLTPEQRALLLDAMEHCTMGPETPPRDPARLEGTARALTQIPAMRIPGVRIAGKTGTAQYGNHLDVAWFICFAPLENPEIALAVAVRSDSPNEGYQGGIEGTRVADAVLKKYFEKKNARTANAVAAR